MLKWNWDNIVRDVDGCLEGNAGDVVLFKNSYTMLDERCFESDKYLNGIVCSNTSSWLQITIKNPKNKVNYKQNIWPKLIYVSNEQNRTFISPKNPKRQFHFNLEVDRDYEFKFGVLPTYTYYSLLVNGVPPGSFVIFKQDFAAEPDRLHSLKQVQSPLTSNNTNKDCYWDNSTNTISYIIKNEYSYYRDFQYTVIMEKCFYLNCIAPTIPPPPTPIPIVPKYCPEPVTSRPLENVSYWSMNETWLSLEVPGNYEDGEF